MAVLPIKLSKEEISHLFERASSSPDSFEIDLLKKEIKVDNDFCYSFEVKDSLLDRIVHNLDDVDITLKDKLLIQEYEKERQKQRAWLFDYSN